jgi:putative methionine-R-sulfoxide reductase with GAF domain
MDAPQSTEGILLRQLEQLLIHGSSDNSHFQRALEKILAHLDCSTGTIHRVGPTPDHLILLAQRGLPDSLLAAVSRIPVGKGMAGLAAQRKEAVQVCNLQSDNTGAARPGARETRMEGAVAVPMLVENTLLRGVLGVAKPVVYEFTAAELELLGRIGELIGRHLGPPTKSEVLDQYFIEVRHKLIEVAAFLDRVDRAEGAEDYRIRAFRVALKELERSEPERAKQILLALSDPTTEPIAEAKGKSAAGAWGGGVQKGEP